MRRGLLLLTALAFASAALGNPYASGITPIGAPGAYTGASFVLNEDADSVQLWLDGGTLGPYALPNTKGTHSFQLSDFGLGGNHTFSIKALKNTAAGWTQISPEDMTTSFYSLRGVSVNRSMSGPNFGTVYLSNVVAGITAFGRPCQDGIYRVRADVSDNGFFTGAYANGTSSPFKSTIGPDGHLYVADFSNDLVWELSEDMSSATQLIDASNKTASQYVESIYVEGTQAEGNRKIYLVDSNYYAGAPGRKGLIQYTLGSNATATPGDTGVQYIGPDYFAFYPRDVARDSSGNWYMNQFRSDPAQAAAITKFTDGPTPINTMTWETPKIAPYNGSYGIDIYEPEGWVAYGNYYDGWVHIFDMDDGTYIGGFDAGSRVLEVAFDAAGNIYTVDNLTERLRIWSPGGDRLFDTSGWFDIMPEPTSLALAVIGLALLRRR